MGHGSGFALQLCPAGGPRGCSPCWDSNAPARGPEPSLRFRVAMLRGLGLMAGDAVAGLHDSKRVPKNRGQAVVLNHQKHGWCDAGMSGGRQPRGRAPGRGSGEGMQRPGRADAPRRLLLQQATGRHRGRVDQDTLGSHIDKQLGLIPGRFQT